MLERKLKLIIKEYYDTVSYALRYKPSEASRHMLRQILNLMLTANGEADSEEECWEAILSTENVLTAADAALLDSSGEDLPEVNAIAYEIKSRLLSKLEIHRLMAFDYDLLLISLEKEAAKGQRSACKLLACLKWLGICSDGNKKAAIELWKALSMDGDRLALNALIYACRETGDDKEAETWEMTASMLDEAYESFSPFVCSGREKKGEAYTRAALILYLNTSIASRSNGDAFMDRALIHYALYSTESLESRLMALSTGQNLYVRMNGENKYRDKKYGF